MYVNNGKISSRQTFRLYVFDLMGIGTLLLPPYLAKLCGCDGIWAIIAGSVLGAIYLFYLGWIMKKMNQDMCSFLRKSKGKVARTLTLGLVGIHSVLTAGFCVYVFSKLMCQSLIQEASFELVAIVLIVVAIYAVYGGIECRARVYEVLFWFVLIPYVAMMLASIRDFEITYWESFGGTDGRSLAEGIYLVFLLITPVFFSLFLIGEKEKNYGTNMRKTVFGALVVTSVILLGSYVLLVGNFGEKGLAALQFPVVTLMSTIQFQGNFLKRMDALMVAVWFFTLYALLNLHLHYGVQMIKELWGEKKQRNRIGIVIMGGVVFGIAYGMKYQDRLIYVFLDYYSYVAVPLMIVGPAVLLIGRRKGV